jgi:hypothetical protein
MKHQALVITCTAWMAIGLLPTSPALADGKAPVGAPDSRALPDDVVVCTGWHALCSASTDCQVNGDRASCDCLRVNETHMVMTSEIHDPVLRRMTQARCNSKHHCEVDEAPVCKVIRDGQYEVDGIKYPWVSTFSYRGWCDLYRPKACDVTDNNYRGDRIWAICDAAPCVENPNPADPNRPLTCDCPIVKEQSFIGTKDSCTGENGGIISAMALWVWDFENDTFSVPVPGYDSVRSACAALESDPFPAR